VTDEQKEQFRKDLADRHVNLDDLISGGEDFIKNNAQQLADALLKYWLSSIFKPDKRMAQHLLVEDGNSSLQDIAEMFEKLFSKIDLSNVIARHIRGYVDGHGKTDLPYEIVADISAELLNRCVQSVGFDYFDDAEITSLKQANDKNALGLVFETVTETETSLEKMFYRVENWTDILKSNPEEILNTYFVPDEEAVFSGRLDLIEAHWSGSTFYQQYERVTNLQRPFDVEFAAVRNEPDSIRLLKNREINSRLFPTYMKYIEEHPNEDATATLVIHVEYDQVLTAIGKLTPEVRNGRMKAELDQNERMFSLVMKRKAAREVVKNDTVTIGCQVPELGLKDLNGNVLELKSLRGKYVVLDFWGSWCTWCIKGFPKLKEYYAKYKDRLEIVGIDCNDTAEKWAAAVKKHKVPWLHVRSEDSIIEQKFRVTGYPYKVLISPEGTVLKAYLGETEEFYQYLDATL
jgi:thiol-disulfide isomerase/thioredoxin